MNILIVGKSGVGKSNFADILKNFIFKVDSNAEVIVDDPDREAKILGHGSNTHEIKVQKVEDNADVNSCEYDIVVNIQSDNFKKWYDKN
jgi:CO dehydrogenase nickel-insertion accessory protein CooC1